jgi:hypothetical protein
LQIVALIKEINSVSYKLTDEKQELTDEPFYQEINDLIKKVKKPILLICGHKKVDLLNQSEINTNE